MNSVLTFEFFLNILWSCRNENCNDSHSYCGLRDQLYPDRRAMGFPFDRQPVAQDHLMKDFVGRFPNMSRTVAEVMFTNTIISRT